MAVERTTRARRAGCRRSAPRTMRRSMKRGVGYHGLRPAVRGATRASATLFRCHLPQALERSLTFARWPSPQGRGMMLASRANDENPVRHPAVSLRRRRGRGTLDPAHVRLPGGRCARGRVRLRDLRRHVARRRPSRDRAEARRGSRRRGLRLGHHRHLPRCARGLARREGAWRDHRDGRRSPFVHVAGRAHRGRRGLRRDRGRGGDARRAPALPRGEGRRLEGRRRRVPPGRRTMAGAPECVAAEIAELHRRFGVDVVLLTDEYPTSDRARWEAFLDRMIELDLGVDLLMETRVPDIVRDRDILAKYVKAGIVHVYVGIEATDQATLNLVNKETTVDENKLALQLLSEHDLVSETSFVLGFPHEIPEHVRETLALAKDYDPDFAHFLAIAPWPYAAMWQDLEPHVVSRDWRRYNLIDPVVKPVAMTLRDVDDAIIDCYRSFYFSKGTQLLAMRLGFRRDYVYRSMKLIMQSSFVKKKMLGRAMPEEVRNLLATLARQAGRG